MNEIVKLNIGGVRYMTTKNTLCKDRNFFSGLLDGKFQKLVDEDGYIFIDREGKYFEPILNFLRSGYLDIPPNIDKGRVFAEADYYSINLEIQIESKAANQQKPSQRLRTDGIYLSKEPAEEVIHFQDSETVGIYFFQRGSLSIVYACYKYKIIDGTTIFFTDGLIAYIQDNGKLSLTVSGTSGERFYGDTDYNFVPFFFPTCPAQFFSKKFGHFGINENYLLNNMRGWPAMQYEREKCIQSHPAVTTFFCENRIIVIKVEQKSGYSEIHMIIGLRVK